MKLYDYQEESAEKLMCGLIAHRAVLDASDTGTGKTPKAVTIAKRLNCPLGIICPLAVVPTWQRWCEEAGIKPSFIRNYEMIRTGRTDLGKWSTHKAPMRLIGGRWQSPGEILRFNWTVSPFHLLAFDEVHYCKSRESKNGEMLSAAKRGGFTTLMMSATAAESPLDFKHIGYTLGLHGGDDRDFFQFAVNHGANRRSGGKDFVFYGNKNGLARLHKLIFTEKGDRVRIAELGAKFPKNFVYAQAYDIGDAQAIYDKLEEALDALAAKTAKDQESELTLRLRARQQVELLRVPLIIEKAQEAITEGRSVAIFVNFRDTLALVAEALDAAVIHGDQTVLQRGEAKQDFQDNKRHAIVCQYQAGGVGIDLHDLKGRPRTALLSPTDDARSLKQALGRIHRDGALSPAVQEILFAANSVEEEVCRTVNRKLTNIEQINDSDLC